MRIKFKFLDCLYYHGFHYYCWSNRKYNKLEQIYNVINYTEIQKVFIYPIKFGFVTDKRQYLICG